MTLARAALIVFVCLLPLTVLNPRWLLWSGAILALAVLWSIGARSKPAAEQSPVGMLR